VRRIKWATKFNQPAKNAKFADIINVKGFLKNPENEAEISQKAG
jgi:hypothetical protein